MERRAQRKQECRCCLAVRAQRGDHPGLARRQAATKALAVAFNDSLPCAGTIVDLSVHGDQAKATFVLGHRPKHRCDGPGEKAAALFVVKHGKITFWEQIPVTTTSPPAA